jgi:hypothetical protein
MWLAQHHSLKRQIMRLDTELKALYKQRQQVEVRGCYSDRELAVKEANLADYDRRTRILKLERDRLQLMFNSGEDREL